MKIVGTTDLKQAHGKRTAREYLLYLAELPNVTLAELKNASIKALNEECNNFILSGFKSSALGEEHFYAFDEEAQGNFGQKASMLALKPDEDKVPWKTDKGVKEHTREQFISLLSDGEVHKEGAVMKFWTLSEKINKTTSERVVLETRFI